MAKKLNSLKLLVLFLTLVVIPHQGVFSASLPQSTQKILKKLKLDPSLLADVDKELKVPNQWIEKAKKEGKLRIMSTSQPKTMKILLAPFHERYPFIPTDYSRSVRSQRVKVLVSYKAGRLLTDILTPIGLSTFYQWEEINGLEDLRTVPGFNNIIEAAKGPNGLVAGIYTLYRCMAYNTRLVKKTELPEKWEDLLTNPRWRGGNLALGNREIWYSPLWKVKGEKWAKDYLTRLFTEVKPQLRKEGLNALPELVAAGEFHAVIPANNGRVYQLSLAGAPVGFTCPEPAPVGIGYAGILKGSPQVNSARIFMNWLLSKEGQIAQLFARDWSSIHKNLNLPQLIRLGENVYGKQLTSTDFEFGRTSIPEIVEFWNDTWLRKRK